MKSLLTRTSAFSNNKITGTWVNILPKTNIKQDKYMSQPFSGIEHPSHRKAIPEGRKTNQCNLIRTSY